MEETQQQWYEIWRSQTVHYDSIYIQTYTYIRSTVFKDSFTLLSFDFS